MATPRTPQTPWTLAVAVVVTIQVAVAAMGIAVWSVMAGNGGLMIVSSLVAWGAVRVIDRFFVGE